MTLSKVFIDAHNCYVSGTDAYQERLTRRFIWETFSVKYRNTRLFSSTSIEFLKLLSFEDILAMALFHGSSIEPLADRYAAWALSALSPSHDANDSEKSPSSTELTRIQRGLYRLQILCNLCGHKDQPDNTHSNFRVTEPDDRRRLLSQWRAWQVEEIFYVHEFAKDQYDRVFHQVARDFCEKTPMHAGTSIWSREEALNLDPGTSSKSTMVNLGCM